jgi:predicted metal-dependent phosphoesterase TrpH
VDTPVELAIEMITDAGGVTVLAHAFARARGPVVTPEVIVELAGLGLAGLEVDHPDHDPPTRAELRRIATDLGLVITGSSDYHGTNKTVRLGQETTAPEMLDALVERATGTQMLVG